MPATMHTRLPPTAAFPRRRRRRRRRLRTTIAVSCTYDCASQKVSGVLGCACRVAWRGCRRLEGRKGVRAARCRRRWHARRGCVRQRWGSAAGCALALALAVPVLRFGPPAPEAAAAAARVPGVVLLHHGLDHLWGVGCAVHRAVGLGGAGRGSRRGRLGCSAVAPARAAAHRRDPRCQSHALPRPAGAQAVPEPARLGGLRPRTAAHHCAGRARGRVRRPRGWDEDPGVACSGEALAAPGCGCGGDAA
jgi:hypothetical protein